MCEQNDNIVILTDEHGECEKFEFLDLVEYKDEEYVVLLPCDDSEDTGEVVILKVEEAGEEEVSYISVENDDDLEAIFEIFKKKFKDKFNFVD